jgi:hypothetical protein
MPLLWVGRTRIASLRKLFDGPVEADLLISEINFAF